jgi:Phage-related protein
MYAKAARTIHLPVLKGHQLRAPYSKELVDGIMELRISFGGNITRVLYFFVIGNTAVLTNGFVKKTTQTPAQEITRAKEYRDDYQRRCLP